MKEKVDEPQPFLKNRMNLSFIKRRDSLLEQDAKVEDRQAASQCTCNGNINQANTVIAYRVKKREL